MENFGFVWEKINSLKNLQMEENKKRPTTITVICIIGFAGTALIIPLIFSPVARQIGSWYPPYLAFSAAAGFICMVGLWKMRKWSVYAYTGFTALSQLVFLTMGVWTVFSLLIPVIVIIIGFFHINKMDAQSEN